MLILLVIQLKYESMSDKKKLYDFRGKEYSARISPFMIILAYPLGFGILFIIGNLFGLIGVSIVLWLVVLIIIGLIEKTPFMVFARITALFYLAIVMWIFADFSMFLHNGNPIHSDWGFWAVVIIGSIVAISSAPRGQLLSHKYPAKSPVAVKKENQHIPHQPASPEQTDPYVPAVY